MFIFNIKDHLKRITGIINKEVLNTQEITDIITKHTGIVKDTDFFEIKDGVLRATLTPSEKMALFIKKEDILHDLKSFGVKDIR